MLYYYLSLKHGIIRLSEFIIIIIHIIITDSQNKTIKERLRRFNLNLLAQISNARNNSMLKIAHTYTKVKHHKIKAN